eukprot:scaffold3722_cov48-Attheya_sp.AAC.2
MPPSQDERPRHHSAQMCLSLAVDVSVFSCHYSSPNILCTVLCRHDLSARAACMSTASRERLPGTWYCTLL